MALAFMFVAATVLDKKENTLRGLASRLLRRLMPPSETIKGYEHPELVDVVFRKALAYTTTGLEDGHSVTNCN